MLVRGRLGEAVAAPTAAAGTSVPAAEVVHVAAGARPYAAAGASRAARAGAAAPGPSAGGVRLVRATATGTLKGNEYDSRPVI